MNDCQVFNVIREEDARGEEERCRGGGLQINNGKGMREEDKKKTIVCFCLTLSILKSARVVWFALRYEPLVCDRSQEQGGLLPTPRVSFIYFVTRSPTPYTPYSLWAHRLHAVGPTANALGPLLQDNNL